MQDFRLRVFVSVATYLNFSKAAKELHISQPAISKHIQELESIYKVKLFERQGSKIKLTSAGEVFFKNAVKIIDDYKQLQLEINLHTGNFSGELRIGASTSIAQYVLPKIIAKYIAQFPDIRINLLTGNSVQIEKALEEHKIDVGLVEGSSRKSSLKYKLLAKDELVLVTNSLNQIEDEISLERLCNLPIILRESGSGTLEVIENTLASYNIKLSQMNILLQIGSTEGIKLFLINSKNTSAFISIVAITNELLDNRLKIVEIENVSFQREFSFVVPQGTQNNIVEQFMQFSIHTYNKKL